MEELRKWFQTGIPARIDALLTARRDIEATPAGVDRSKLEGMVSIRRIARLLFDTADRHGYPEIALAAEYVLTAPKLGPEFDQLLLELRQAESRGVETDDRSTLLIIDDDPSLLELLSTVLEGPGREILVAKTAAEAQAHLEMNRISLILLDLVLPDTDGRNFLLKLKENPATAPLPVLVLSAKIGAQPKTECFALGADAYFEKPIEIEILAAAVSSWLQRTEVRMREARRDPLTGLQNRAAFREAFLQHASLATRKGESLSVAILDLDRFKSVNDTYGHSMGDQVLKRTSDVLKATLRRSDWVARWGGEEFVVLFPGTDEEGAAQAMWKALESLREVIFESPDGKVFGVTFSAGIALAAPGQTVEEAVAEADKFLYLAKESGRNRVLTSTEAPKEAPQSVLVLAVDEAVTEVVRRRLEREGFSVETAANPQAGLTAVENREFALCLLDSRLPGTQDLLLVETLRRRARAGALPILLLTEAGEEDLLAKGFERGVDDYIVKPFTPMELLTRVRTLVRRGRPSHAVQKAAHR
jgi:diguanylate cyclase (GGDEF)-like protein